MTTNCGTTHHQACDCREAKFAAMEAELVVLNRTVDSRDVDIAAIKAALQVVKTAYDNSEEILLFHAKRADKAEAENGRLRAAYISDMQKIGSIIGDCTSCGEPNCDDCPTRDPLGSKHERICEIIMQTLKDTTK